MEASELTEVIVHMQADLRAELVARELTETGYCVTSDVLIVPDGAFKRSYERDVTAIETITDPDEVTRPYIRIHTSREGITDMIPPGVIYQPTINRQERSTDVILEEIDIHDSEHNQARTFFLPFDAEFGRQKIQLEVQEHYSVTDTYSYYSEELYTYLWPDLQLELTSFQKATLLELTIQAHSLVGNYPICEQYLKKILGYEVCIQMQSGNILEHEEVHGMMPLGKCNLGVSWIPFEQYVDQNSINIIIGPVPEAEIIDFRYHLPVGKSFQILEFLCDLLLPIEVSWHLTLVPGEAHFHINRTKETGVLGYSTIL